jgi:hypothetical protein
MAIWHRNYPSAFRFYSVLKATDQWLRFVFLTGVTKFATVSIFSTLNQLRDISMSEEFAGIWRDNGSGAGSVFSAGIVSPG